MFKYRLTGSALLAVATTALGTTLFGTAALATCSDFSPGGNDTVTCSGTITDEIDDGSDGVTINILPGTDWTVSKPDTRAIDIGDSAKVNVQADATDGKAKVEATDADAIRVDKGTATDPSIVTNDGNIIGGSDGVQGKDYLVVNNNAGGTITAAKNGVEAEGRDNVTVTNFGLIDAAAKGIRARPDGADGGSDNTLVNVGTVRAGTEGFEAGDTATVVNTGLIEAGEDAVQVGNGADIQNLAGGVIRSNGLFDPDEGKMVGDAIDMDSGTVYNEGEILSAVDAAIDFDGNETGIGEIINTQTGVIRGAQGITVEKGPVEPANVSAQIIENYGVIEATNGLALDLGLGDDAYTHGATAMIIGGADFGGGEDILDVKGGAMGALGGASLATFDGGADTDTVLLEDYALTDVSFTTEAGGTVLMSLMNGGSQSLTARLLNWENAVIGQTTYSIASLATVTPVPLPAGVLLLGSALFGLGALRARQKVV
ncbi:MAG: VPLPA-CTERM sorting domain-containing protein [Pseudomonadota bacterium]